MPRKLWIDFKKVRESLDFQSVLSHYGIEVKMKKEQVQVHCPFHDDNTPSCSINTTKDIFRCFGCSAQGNVLEFVVMMEGGDPAVNEDMHKGAQTALEILGASPKDFGRQSTEAPDRVRAKQKPPADPPPQEEKPKRVKAKQKDGDPAKDQDPEPDEEPAVPEHNEPLSMRLTLEHTHPFLEERGISSQTAERFELGYCKAGIMKGRIAILIHNLEGEIVAYVGRWANEEIPEDTIRYKFPKLFHKSLELFNIHRAQTFGARHLTLVEGYWSSIRWHDAGIPVAALMGTSCSDEQAQLVLAAGFKYVTLLMDGDDAGRKAAEANASILAKHVYVRLVELPEGEKPDSVPDRYLDKFR